MVTFPDTFIMFKTSHLGVSKFSFSHFAHFVQIFLIKCQFYPKTTRRFGNGVVLELGKISIAENFLCGKGKVRENQTLIHLSKNF